MSFLRKGVFVTISVMPGDHAPHPNPLKHGFSMDYAYQVLDSEVRDTSSEYLLWLANDRDELFLISNRHLRLHHIDASKQDAPRVKLPPKVGSGG